jgi:hypothetical protein
MRVCQCTNLLEILATFLTGSAPHKNSPMVSVLLTVGVAFKTELKKQLTQSLAGFTFAEIISMISYCISTTCVLYSSAFLILSPNNI